MALKLVPFNASWINHEKLDIHAIYLRPSRVEDEYGDRVQARGPDGQPLWDITGPLPVRQHNVWEAKGFKYLTLANAVGPEGGAGYLMVAARNGTLAGGSVRDYAQDPRTGGPWNLKKYLEGQVDTATEGLAQLERDVLEFGSIAVEKIRRRVDPGFTLPPHLRDRQPGEVPEGAGPVAEGQPVAVTSTRQKVRA